MGSDCIIRHPCPKLEVLLLRRRTQSALQGTPFRDLVDSGERDRFDHFMASMTSVTKTLPADDVTDQDDFACTFHFHMKDASGTKVPVQMFHGSCLDINDQICHVVGIREDQETPARMEAAELRTSVDGGLSPLMEHVAMPTSEAESDTSSLSASEPAAEVAVWIDTATTGYIVTRCTPGFSALCGPSAEGIQLLLWMNSTEREQFRAWVEHGFNKFYYDGGRDIEKPSMEITLTPPHLKRFKISVKVTVEVAGIEVFGDDEQDEGSEQIVVQLTFSGLSWNQGHARKQRPRPPESNRRTLTAVSI